MVKGFYNLTSGMLTQRRTLDVISTNMSNVSTIGYKADTLLSSTFDEALLSRTGNEDKAHPEGLADTSMARIPRETVTNFDIGNLRPSYSPLDFAIISDGFFQVQNENGEVRYTRNGSFNIDDRGYICTQDGDLVLGENGPIQVYYPDSETQFNAEKVQVDQSGNVSDSDGNFVDKFAIVTFVDTTQLVKQDGYFTGGGEPLGIEATIQQRYLEASNVEPVKEMVKMIESERHLQSMAQVLKMYDQMIAKAATDIGRI